MLVERPKHIKVRFQTLAGVADGTVESEEPMPTELYLRGLMCRIFQHEVDHLDGKVIWDEDYKATNFKMLGRQPTSELADPETFEKFYKENAQYML